MINETNPAYLGYRNTNNKIKRKNTLTKNEKKRKHTKH